MLAQAGLVAVLVVLAATLVTAAAPVAFGFRAVVVHGGSMGDSIPNGSLVMARWVNTDDIETGDAILIQESGSGGPAAPKLHRIVSLEADGPNILVRTKGDANDSPDPNVYVLPDRVLTPAYHVKYLGLLVAFITTTGGWLLFIAAPGSVLCLLTLRSIWFPEPRATAAPSR